MRSIKEWLYPWVQRLRRAPLLFWFLWYTITMDMEKNAVLLFSSERESLTGNLRFLSDTLAARRPELTVTVVLRGDIAGERVLARRFARSAWIFVEEFEPRVYVLPLRRGQRLVQVWHAIGAFKKVGFARENTVKTSLSHRNYTDVIVSSEEVRPCYAASFGVPLERVRALGAARTDAFFDKAYQAERQRELLTQYPALREKKMILFAPTFRGNDRGQGYYPMELLPLKALYEAFHEEYVLGVKLHPLIRNTLEVVPRYREFVLDLTGHREVNDLLQSAAVLVTDYSSVIFENALLGTPVVFYVPDYEDYAHSRGFYFPFEDYLYGPKVQTAAELVQAVRSESVDEGKRKTFRERFLGSCDGHVSERMVEALFS